MLRRLACIGSRCTFREISRVLPQHFDDRESTLVAALTLGRISASLRISAPVSLVLTWDSGPCTPSKAPVAVSAVGYCVETRQA